MSNLLDKIKKLKTIQDQTKELDTKINTITENKKHQPDDKNINTQKEIYTQSVENIIKHRHNTDEKKTTFDKDLNELETHNEKKKQPTLLHNKEVKSFINDIILEESKNSNININYDEIEVDDTILLSMMQSNDLQNLNKTLKHFNK